MKALFPVAAAVALALAASGWFFVGTRTGQDLLLERFVAAGLDRAAAPRAEGLRVFMCGTSSPLIAPGRAQACVAVTAGDALYIVDAGTGSNDVMLLAGEPLQPLRAILLTHFHSDHIAGIADFNLASWVAGRPAPLRIAGPAGVERIAAGFNEAFALDRRYRVAHHGADLLPPELGVLEAETVAAGVILERDGLRITAFPVDHSPVEPAFGYRFDHGGRSVVVSGDTVVVEPLRAAAQDADLLLHDALSLAIVSALEAGARQAGRIRQATILRDVQDYHAAVGDLPALAASADVGMLALYHLVPAPRNFLMEQIFARDLPDDAVLTTEGMVFELPRGTDAIHVHAP
ncbi:MAG: MBL fold metallo-hydrolase [Acidobacteria bacterium]|nr:MBL fold metallo-hydrolase [Acidobacteriota bacterium]